MVDLHSHSYFSDGTYSPEELLHLAKKRGLEVLALTDHDTLDGLSRARMAADKEGIRLVPGVELSIEIDRGEFHLLGLGINPHCPDLQNVLSQLREDRDARNKIIVEKMRKSGIDVSYEEIQAIARQSAEEEKTVQSKKRLLFFHKKPIPGEDGRALVVGRPHFARFLVNRGITRSMGEAFEKYLKQGRSFYEDKKILTLEEALPALNRSNGLAVVAHPLSLHRNFDELDKLFDQWKEMGIRGIETVHPSAKRSQSLRLEEMAIKHGLLVTAGSDFHGANAPQRKLGRTGWGSRIPARFSSILDEINSLP